MNYKSIKALARERGERVTELLALSAQNDPFYVGTKSDVAKARWFADIWERFGYTRGLHLRRVHYEVVSQREPIVLPVPLSWKVRETGERKHTDVYLNNDRCWQELELAGKYARYLGYVNPAAFVDRRNPVPIINAEARGEPELSYWLDEDWGWGALAFPDMPRLYAHTEGNLQPYHLEVWCEKSTMNDVLEPLCRNYQANLVTGLGEMSITAALALVERVEDIARPCRIAYVSDFDPAGAGMPISVARKIEFFVQELPELDIRLNPVVLTRAQVQEYELPRKPIKDGDRRKSSFEDAFGEGAVELDALQALHPGLLAQIVGDALGVYYDEDIRDKACDAQDALQDALDDASVYALGDLAEEQTALKADFEQAMGGYRDKIKDLHARMGEQLAGVRVDLGDHPMPEARRAMESNTMMFESGRDYTEQLAAYKVQRSGKG